MIIILILIISSLLFSVENVFYCNIKDTKVDVQVEYNPSNGIYSYKYSVYSGLTNNGWIDVLSIDISTKTYHPKAIDPDLYDNCRHFDIFPDYYKHCSNYAIPVGLSTSHEKKECGSVKRTIDGVDVGAYAGLGFPKIEPGQSVTGLVIQAKYPPGIRDFEIIPDFVKCYGHIPMDEEHWDQLMDENGNSEGFTRPKGFGKDEDWYLYGKTIGPIDPADYQFYNGGGQKPDDVNLFLKYANPLERETKLAKGENTFDLIMYYGETIIPSTFKAELNGIDITSKFQPVPKVAEVEKLNLQKGRNTLILSVDGKNQKGQVATDTDRLVFIVEQ